MSAALRVLIVEDDPGHAELTLRALRKGGFDVTFERADRLPDVRTALERNGWDVVLTDHSLPGFKSVDVLTLMKVLAPYVPLIVVSGQIGEGEVVDLLHRGAAHYVDKGYMSRLAPVVERVLEQSRLRKEHAAAQAQLELLHAAVDGANDLVCVLEGDPKRPRLLYANAAAERLTGRTSAELMQHGYEMLFGPQTDREAIARLQSALAAGGAATEELLHYMSDGSTRWIELAIRPLRGEPTRFIAVSRDVSERKAYEAKLSELALHDPLTGLANRKLLEDRLEHELARARRAGSTVGVLLMDLDDFKSANDWYGHSFGDALLREFARRVRAAVREADTVARLGGDEFVVVMAVPNPDAAAEVEHAARRIVESASLPFTLDGKSHSVYASVGIALSPQDGDDGESLLRRADAGMYRAKVLGAHGYAFASLASG